MRRRPLIFLLVLWAMAMAGCSSEAQHYDDLSDLASAVDSAGVECNSIEPGPEAELVGDSGTCAGSDLTLFLFERPQDLEDWSQVATRLGPTLIGMEWAVTGGATELDQVSAEIGGDVVDANP